MQKKIAQTGTPIHDLIAQRWSPRAFDKSGVVTREQLTSLLEAARWAPSCFGDEPWRYLVWDRNHDAAAWEKAFDCLAEANQKWVKNAPVLLCACADSLFGHNATPNRWAQYDTGAASENLVLQAVALGLAAHQMGGFDAQKIRITFSVPEAYMPMAMIAVGYQAEASVLEDPVQEEREIAARTRKPLGERFFEGSWGQGIG